MLVDCVLRMVTHIFIFFFFNDTATTEIYTLSLHDALPIYFSLYSLINLFIFSIVGVKSFPAFLSFTKDRKSTRLNSSHANISYAVFCLKKKKNTSSPLTQRYQVIAKQMSLRRAHY